MRRFLPFLAAAFVVLGAAGLSAAAGGVTAVAAAPWADQFPLTSPTEQSTQAPSVASASDGSIVAVTTVAGVGVSARRSVDGGVTWAASVQLSSSLASSASGGTILRLNDGSLVAAWAENTSTGGVSQILLRHSTDAGQTWSFSRVVSNRLAGEGAAAHPVLARVDNAGVAVAYTQSDGTWTRARLSTAATAEGDWVTGTFLSPASNDASNVSVTTGHGQDALVSWTAFDGSNYLTQVAGTGNGWQVTTLSSFGTANAFPAAITVNRAGDFIVLWTEANVARPAGQDFNILSQTTSNAGSTWFAPRCVSANSSTASPSASSSSSPSSSSNPAQPCDFWHFVSEPTVMTLDDGSILAAWTMAVPQTFIQTARGDAAGQLWSTPLDVQAPVLNIANYQPVLAQAGDGLVALVWVCAVSGTYSAQYSFSNTRGSSWLSQGGNLSSWPDDVAGVSVVPFVNKGFAFGWNQRTGTAPDQAIFRPYGWVAQPTPAPSAPESAATLANTGTSDATAPLGIVAAILIALGWIIRARLRQRSA